MTTPHPALIWSLVSVGITAISFASIFIRLADAPAITIAAYRVALAALALGPFFALKQATLRKTLDRKTALATVLSGCFLAMHFVFWITSLQMTSVASSVALVSTTPLFVALFSYSLLRQRPEFRLGLGIVFTTVGSFFVAGTDFSLSTRAMWGDLLAIGGAVMAAGYLMAGQFVQRSLDLTSYIFGAYGTAALVLLPCCYFSGTPLTGFSDETYLMLVLLALVPQLIGHTTFNWTLKFLQPSAVSILILGEPIGASILAFLFFREGVGRLKGVGLFIVGVGIVLGSRAFSPRSRNEVTIEPAA